jgi:hypothetical protein
MLLQHVTQAHSALAFAGLARAAVYGGMMDLRQ